MISSEAVHHAKALLCRVLQIVDCKTGWNFEGKKRSSQGSHENEEEGQKDGRDKANEPNGDVTDGEKD